MRHETGYAQPRLSTTLVLLALFLFFKVNTAIAAAPNVVASIGPLHSIASALMDGIAEPHLIIRPGDSAHHFQLRPSDVEALNNADHIFWIGPDLEVFLNKPIRALANSSASIPLDDLPGLTKLKPRHLKDWKIEEYHDEEGSGHSEDSDHSGHSGHSEHFDLHLWMDPKNALLMAEFIAHTLIKADSSNQTIYRKNLSLFKHNINNLDDFINLKLKDKTSQRFLLDHDAFQYFEWQYALQSVGAVTLYHDSKPGAAHVRTLKSKISGGKVSCFVSTAKVSGALLETLFDNAPVKTVVSDPLGGGFPSGPEQYFNMMRSTAEQLADCLT